MQLYLYIGVVTNVLVLLAEWRQFVKRKSRKWLNHIYIWLTTFDGPKHVVFYEHLKSSLHEELINLSLFLDVNSTLLDIWCTVKEQEGLYHRAKPDWFVSSSFYTEELKFIVESKIDTLSNFMKQFAVPRKIQIHFDTLYRKNKTENKAFR